ncbi:MAG TPA: RIP metalloprotease RseP [bacterium]|jgi:regulator of sigma E protease|nr:RIP metalloprotease RseP [bacterium]
MLLTLIAFIIILGILVLAHELGHFLFAKLFKARVEEFGFGYPPRVIGIYKDAVGKRKIVWGKKKIINNPHTIYSLNLIPIGGFVKIKGENGDEKNDGDSFGAKKIWQRIIILVAGVTMNVVLAIILLTICFNTGITTIVDDANLAHTKNVKDLKIQVVSVNKNSPASEAGLLVNDELININTLPIKSVEFLQNFTQENPGRIIDLEILRNNEKLLLKIEPRVLPTSNNKAVLGIGLAKTAFVAYNLPSAFWQGAKATYNLTIAMFSALIDLLKNIISKGEMTAELAGPVGIVFLTDQAVDMGISYVLQFAALLSLNLALINILPIPALDGSRILFLIIEKIRRKEMNQKIEALIHNLGFALLMILIIKVTYDDLARWGGRIIEKIF